VQPVIALLGRGSRPQTPSDFEIRMRARFNVMQSVRDGLRDGLRDMYNTATEQPPMEMPAGMPVELDFEAIGFDMGIVGGNAQAAAPAPAPYEAPPPAPDGFTRSPREGDVLVCPNCGDELGEGKTDRKKQMWVVKKCGHVGFPASWQFLLSGNPLTRSIRSTVETATRTVQSLKAKRQRVWLHQSPLRRSKCVLSTAASRKPRTGQP
ncbi:MAG: hypothetical protein INR71_01370, partial [Terriglobus roseus]|nr:hypothetical protein [Terriglobus roseus]